jgi:hypothetical protein
MRLSWKSLPGTNNLAYYENPSITTVISFIVQAPGYTVLSPDFVTFHDGADVDAAVAVAVLIALTDDGDAQEVDAVHVQRHRDHVEGHR